MANVISPTIRKGGVNTVYVMVHSTPIELV